MRQSVFNPTEIVTATITSGAALSGAVNLGGLRLFSFVMPASWTAASVTFQASQDGGTSWADLYDSAGNEVTATVAVGRCVLVDPSQFSSLGMIRLRSGTGAAPVAQGADRALTLVLRSV